MERVTEYHKLLFSLAYNMLGEVQEAEDVVQDVYETWFSKQPEVKFPKAYLCRAVINRAMDRLELLKKERALYKGPWLPVPIVSGNVSTDAKHADPLPYAMLAMMEKLNPVERAAFILREAFDFPYGEIAEMCDISEENARQLVHRAQDKLQNNKVRFKPSTEETQHLLTLFLQACATLDPTALKQLLHDQVVMYSDGGGKVNAAVVPIHGADKITKFLLNVLKDATELYDGRAVIVNESPGALLINKLTGITDTICTIAVEDHKIIGVYFLRNPEKIFC